MPKFVPGWYGHVVENKFRTKMGQLPNNAYRKQGLNHVSDSPVYQDGRPITSGQKAGEIVFQQAVRLSGLSLIFAVGRCKFLNI